MAESGTIDLEISSQVTGLSATDTVRAGIDTLPERAVSVSGTTVNKSLSINAIEGEHRLTLNVYDAASSAWFSIKNMAHISPCPYPPGASKRSNGRGAKRLYRLLLQQEPSIYRGFRHRSPLRFQLTFSRMLPRRCWANKKGFNELNR